MCCCLCNLHSSPKWLLDQPADIWEIFAQSCDTGKFVVFKKKRRRWGGRIGEGAVSMETLPLQLSEAKVSLGSFPNRTSILSTVLARKVFCIHNTSLSQEERPIAAEQQMHLPLRICPFKELWQMEILQNEYRADVGTQVLSSTCVCWAYLEEKNTLLLLAVLPTISKFLSLFSPQQQTAAAWVCSVSSPLREAQDWAHHDHWSLSTPGYVSHK